MVSAKIKISGIIARKKGEKKSVRHRRNFIKEIGVHHSYELHLHTQGFFSCEK